jgi:hypothetical protein
MSVKEFKNLREKIDGLVKKAEELIEGKLIVESSEKVKEGYVLLAKLDKIADEDQKSCITRLTEDFECLAERIEEIQSKREAGKKEDGNVAFKCTWNDKHYKALCSKEAYEFNISQGRAWCSSPDCKCREYIDEVTLENHPCYESIALKEMYYGAGWDHSGGRNQPRHIYSVRQGRMAILTTRLPDTEEKDRLIIACLYIGKVEDDPEKETKIYAVKEKSIEIDYDKIKIKFWDYYKNANAEDLKLWASGLFRYITDETVLNIVKDIERKYEKFNMNTKVLLDTIKYYENIIQNKREKV